MDEETLRMYRRRATDGSRRILKALIRGQEVSTEFVQETIDYLDLVDRIVARTHPSPWVDALGEADRLKREKLEAEEKEIRDLLSGE